VCVSVVCGCGRGNHVKSHTYRNKLTHTHTYIHTHTHSFSLSLTHTHEITHIKQHTHVYQTIYIWVATISRLLQIVGLFCKRDLLKRRYSAKETYIFEEPTNRSHPICIYTHTYIETHTCIGKQYMYIYINTHAYMSIYKHTCVRKYI